MIPSAVRAFDQQRQKPYIPFSTELHLSSQHVQSSPFFHERPLQWHQRIEESPKTFTSGDGEAGTRAFSSKGSKTERQLGGRFDYGEKFESDGKDYQRINFQVNSNADNSQLKDLAKKNAHKKWSFADLEVKEYNDDDERNQAIENMRQQMEDNMQPD